MSSFEHLFSILSSQSIVINWSITGFIYGSIVLLIIFKYAYWVYVWQLKEYRIDRMVDFFTTRTGKRSVFNVWIVGEIIFAVLLSVSSLLLPWLWIDVFFVFFIGVQLVRYIRHHITPTWTIKALALVGVGVFITVLLFILGLWISVLELFVVAVLLFAVPLIVSALVFALRPLTQFYYQRMFQQARQCLLTLHPTVIGITGSYGKTSTKHFLQTILSQQASVLATPEHVNVDIGVAQTIVRELTPQHQYFIVEMGAYREGEIQSICNIVRPMIGILLAIREQHLSLFGSIDAVQRAKSELLAALPSSGLAVINADSKRCVAAAEVTVAHKRFFSVRQAAHVYATDIHVTIDTVRFCLHIRDRYAVVEAPLYGAQTIPSLLAAVTAADYVGMTMEQIIHGIESIRPVAGTMQLKRGINGCTVIDDSYNCNTDGFIAALAYLQLFSDKRKIVLTPGMLELGKEADRLHRIVGGHIGTAADVCIITKKDTATPLRDGMKRAGMRDGSIIVDDRPRRVCETILHSLSSDDVVLLEGRVHPYYHEYLLSE